MSWSNPPLSLYHGTSDAAAQRIGQGPPSVSVGSRNVDFGKGFYTTTNRHQAANWARMRTQRSGGLAVVIEFAADRDALAGLEVLVFVLEDASTGYWDFVEHCRGGPASPPDHARQQTSPVGAHYQAVYGPVSLWPQRLVIKDCDQISFHDQAAASQLKRVATHKL